MTNKECIDILESQIRAYPDDMDFDKLRNALSHAIEVLKASEAKAERHKRIKQFLRDGNNVHKKD